MSDHHLFGQVDQYLEDLFIGEDPLLNQVLANSEAAQIPAIQVSPLQGKFLMLMVQITGAKRVLEIGTLTGYSSLWLARALPADGQLITLEFQAKHAALAQQHFDLADLSDRITCHQGPALDTLPSLEGDPPFDLVFIDADKVNYSAYLDWALRLTRPGSVIIADNVVRRGQVLDPARVADEDERIAAQAVRDFNATMATHDQLDAIA